MAEEIKEKETEIANEVAEEAITEGDTEVGPDSPTLTEEATAEISEQQETPPEAEDQEQPSEALQEAPSEPTLEEQLAAAQAETAKNLEGWQRAAADLANYKKRQAEQVQRIRGDITANIIREILPALDDLDLAFQNVPDTLSEQEASWVEGFRLVQRKLLKILENNNIQPIDTNGEFDPNLHEAITHESSPDHETNAIIAEVRKGYTIDNRVLRPALVRVAQ
jgi:molecular chaperone GrpE